MTTQVQYQTDEKGFVFKAFCPTGPGGGVDPTCSPGGHPKERMTAIALERKEVTGIAKKHGMKKVKGVFSDEDSAYFGVRTSETESKSVIKGVSSSLKSSGYKKIKTDDGEEGTLYSKKYTFGQGQTGVVNAKVGYDRDLGEAYLTFHGKNVRK